MKNKNAFTLIEVMVVLSVLALMAVLAYNFFGSTIKEAKMQADLVRVKKDMESISTAIEMRFLKEGTYNGVSLATLVAGGYLKEELSPPNGYNQFPGNRAYSTDAGTWDLGGDTAKVDYTVRWDEITEDFCKSWNDEFTDFGYNYAITGSFAIFNNANFQVKSACYDDDSWGGKRLIYLVISDF